MNLSDYGIDPNDASSIRREQRVIMSLYFIAITALGYDTFLMMPQEIGSIWKGRWSAVTLIYGLMRYGTMLSVVLGAVPQVLIPASPKVCDNLASLAITFTAISYLALLAFQCLRLWVISGRDWKATTIVFVINWVPPLLDLYNQVHNHTSTMVPSGPLAGCYTIPTPSAPTYPIGAISRAATMLSDAIILYVTVMSSVHAYRSRSTEVPSTKTMLYQLLLRNGVTQFITLFMINVVALFIEIYVLTSGLNTDSNVLCIVDGISAIIICRFLLDLRAIYPATTTDQIGRSDSTHTSGIRFAKSFIGNIGAPTRQTMSWVSSAEEIDRLEAEVPVYSNESLRFIASDYTTDTEVEMRNMGSRHA